MICPSCGRETPAAETCAHCGATLSVKNRFPLGVLKWATLLLALLGTAALIFSARRFAVPQVKIDSLNAAVNLAYVRVSGRIISTPRYDPDSQSLSFHLSDDTGEITIHANRAETQSLISNSLIPQLGDRITLEGALRLREDSLSLTLAASDSVVIEHPTPGARFIGSISNQEELTLVIVRGQILDRRDPYPGLTVLTLADPTGQIDAVVPADVVSLTGPLPEMGTGDFVQFTGVVTLYRNAPQLTLTASQNIHRLQTPPDFRLPAPILPPTVSAPQTATPIHYITLGQVGDILLVEARITAAEDFSKGKRFTLDDGSGSIILLLWQDVYDQLPDPDQLQPGAKVRVTGEIEVFDGQFEIIPREASDIVVEPTRP